MPARYSIPLIASGLIASGLLLNACQPQHQQNAAPGVADLTPPDPEPDAPPMAISAPALPDAFAGRWFVSAVYPVGASRASIGDQHLGVSLVIGTDEASDVNGQRCLGPAIAVAAGRQDLAIGSMSVSGAEKISITCKGKAFADYLLLPGTRLDASYDKATELPHALISQRPEAHYLLERAEHVLLRQASLPAVMAGEGKLVPSTPVTQPTALAKPVAPQTPALSAPLVLAPALPEPAEPVAAAPVSVPPAAPAAATPVVAAAGDKLPAPGAAIHLASYSGITAAKRGWKILLGDFDALDPLSPLYVTVDVPQKGPMVRLYATGGDAAGLGQACTALRAKGAYCELSR